MKVSFLRKKLSLYMSEKECQRTGFKRVKFLEYDSRTRTLKFEGVKEGNAGNELCPCSNGTTYVAKFTVPSLMMALQGFNAASIPNRLADDGVTLTATVPEGLEPPKLRTRHVVKGIAGDGQPSDLPYALVITGNGVRIEKRIGPSTLNSIMQGLL